MPESAAEPTARTSFPELAETLVATTRYLQALTGLDDEAARQPSVLPGWSRAHVVAHLSRNADAFERVVTSASAGEPATMYDAQDVRDLDIEETARLDAARLVEDARGSARRLRRALETCHADPATPYARVPGGTDTWPLETVCVRRRIEVEVHHADLDLGYRPADWPADFSLGVVGRRHEELGALGDGCPILVLVATDVDGRWRLGTGQGPEIRGAVGDLAWWLVGRGAGRGLSGPTPLPRLDPWR